MRERSEPRPIDHTDIARDTARDLREIASHIGQLKGDANAYLTDPNYTTLKLRLESAFCNRGCCGGGQEEGAAQRGLLGLWTSAERHFSSAPSLGRARAGVAGREAEGRGTIEEAAARGIRGAYGATSIKRATHLGSRGRAFWRIYLLWHRDSCGWASNGLRGRCLAAVVSAKTPEVRHLGTRRLRWPHIFGA